MIILTPAYGQEQIPNLEVVYQYHADSLTGRVIKGFYRDSSYFPIDQRNQWQYRYSRQGGPPPIPNIVRDQVTSQTVINGKGYRRYSVFGKATSFWNWVRYETENQKLYAYINSTDVPVADFTLPDSTTVNFISVMDNVSGSSLAYYSGFGFAGETFESQYYLMVHPQSSRRYRYSKGIGWTSFSFNSISSSKYYNISQAVIYDSLGKAMFFDPTQKPLIISHIPDAITTLTLPIEFEVDHPYNYFYIMPSYSEEHFFIKSATFVGIYIKGTDTLFQASPPPLSRTRYTETYRGSVQLNDSLLQEGYSYYYKIYAVDLNLVPLSDAYPAEGFKAVTYTPQVGHIETDFSHRLEIAVSGYPNPVSNASTFKYTVPVSGDAELKIFDILGNELFTVFKNSVSAGTYSYPFSGLNLPSGIYIARLTNGGKSTAMKLKVLR